MRYAILALALAFGGCGIFSTPGKVTSPEATSEAGGVYAHVIQPQSGIGCPSVVAMGAQTMGGLDASCLNGGANQSIHLTAPDPNPALTTAYNGINQQLTTVSAMLQQMMSVAMAAAFPPAAIGIKPVPVAKPMMLQAPVQSVAPGSPCPPGTVPVTIGAGGTTCQ